MFHKRGQLGSHIDTLCSAWKDQSRTQHRNHEAVLCKMVCGHWPASDRAAASSIEHLVVRHCFVSHVFKIHF